MKKKILMIFTLLLFMPSMVFATSQQTLGELKSEYQTKLNEQKEG